MIFLTVQHFSVVAAMSDEGDCINASSREPARIYLFIFILLSVSYIKVQQMRRLFLFLKEIHHDRNVSERVEELLTPVGTGRLVSFQYFSFTHLLVLQTVNLFHVLEFLD